MVRLVDLGVEPWIVANALSAVLAQRLVRVVCPHCKAATRLDRDIWDGDELLMPSGTEVVRPRSCDRCMRTGYKGRTGLFEVVELDDEIRELVEGAGALTSLPGSLLDPADREPATSGRAEGADRRDDDRRSDARHVVR